MNLSRSELISKFNIWLTAWNDHNLEGVMEFLHEEIVFENWNGDTISGKNTLQRAWLPWFIHHGNFKFINEGVFIDEWEQKMSFAWRLEWHSLEKSYKGKPEIRRGVDVLQFLDQKIIRKYSYSKTDLLINSKLVLLTA